jgi:hypothetical protein
VLLTEQALGLEPPFQRFECQPQASLAGGLQVLDDELEVAPPFVEA